MTSETSIKLNVDVVCDALRKLVTLNQSDIDATLQHLEVPLAERPQVKAKLESLLSGNAEVVSELETDLSSSEEGGAISQRSAKGKKTPKGGKTKFILLKALGIPYGARLYVDHNLVAISTDISGFIAAVLKNCGPEAATLAAGLAITAAALKLLDRGNGIIITRIPITIGPCIPTPQ